MHRPLLRHAAVALALLATATTLAAQQFPTNATHGKRPRAW